MSADPAAFVRERLAEMKARAEKATKGPWVAAGLCLEGPEMEHVSQGSGAVIRYRPEMARFGRNEFMQERRPTIDFIAHARTDLPALVAALEEALAWHYPAFDVSVVKALDDAECNCHRRYPCATLEKAARALGWRPE